ncbi:MAG TPA: RNA-binding protein [Planctomycetota bacterium]|nr:RNA-binding protein [Planctomycetota bacterium]
MIFVDNLSFETSEQDLREMFSEDGRSVERVSIATAGDAGQSRGFALVEMAPGTELAGVVQALHGRELRGHVLLVSEADDRGPPQRSGRPLGDFGGRW